MKIVERLKLRIRAEASGAITAEWDPPGSDQLSIFLYYCKKNGVDHNMCDVGRKSLFFMPDLVAVGPAIMKFQHCDCNATSPE